MHGNDRTPWASATPSASAWTGRPGVLYVGDYGPDAGTANPARGPGGQVEFARVTGPGNFGWPYCTGRNDAYVDYDFATKTCGAAFDCAAPKNNSPHNNRHGRAVVGQPGRLSFRDIRIKELPAGGR